MPHYKFKFNFDPEVNDSPEEDVSESIEEINQDISVIEEDIEESGAYYTVVAILELNTGPRAVQKDLNERLQKVSGFERLSRSSVSK